MRCAVCIPTGPGEADARRLRTLVSGLFRHEPAVSLLVVADASGEDATSRLRESVPPSCQGVRIDCVSAAGGPCTPSQVRLMALRYLADRDDYDVCLHLELTSLVIAPFAGRLTRFLYDRPSVGQVGRLSGDASDRPPAGPRSVRWPRPGRLSVRRGRWARRDRLRKIARLAGAGEPGTHCVGNVAALTRPAVASLETSGLLAVDWPATADPARLVSTLVLAAGWSVADYGGPGEVFGVSPTGLPASPQALSEEGAAVLSDVTTDSHHSEAEIVAYFDRGDTASLAA